MSEGDSKVISFWGNHLPVRGEPEPEVVAQLEDILERARSGEVTGVIVVTVDHDEAATIWTSGTTDGFGVVGALQCATARAAGAANQYFDDANPD